MEHELEHPTHRFRGYHTLGRLQLHEHDLTLDGWVPHVYPGEYARSRYWAHVQPFGFLEVLERDGEFDDRHGAPRLAILFLGADGIATYDALFCQGNNTPPPFAILLQDHGFGGNYNKFGGGGLLEHIAIDCNVFPRFLFAADHTIPWAGFERIPDLDGYPGGMHAIPRFLYQRQAG